MPTHRSASIANTGVYSDDSVYRYSLTRCWDPALAKLLFVMHNPSKATEVLNDDTVMACQNVAWLIGHPDHPNRISTTVVDELPCFGSIRVCNLYPAFATSVTDMAIPCPVLRENDCEIKRSCRWADTVICAWGKPRTATQPNREHCVKEIIRAETEHVLCFGQKCGHPIHPRAVKVQSRTCFPETAQDTDGSVSTEKRLLYRLQRWQIL